MQLKQAVVSNIGMSQDVSISRADNKYAFENENVRIQATDDGTLLAITNIKSPKLLSTAPENITILGKCFTPDYLIIFGKTNTDVIYRVNLSLLGSGDEYECLYRGDLNFSKDSYFDTLYYEESENVKKVYWTDGVNFPRVINIITPEERKGNPFSPYTKNDFEFYPTVARITTFNVTKNRDIVSELPAGVIQYFISFYKINGAESLIIDSSSLCTIDYKNKGGKADESGMCAFNISISFTDPSAFEYDYIRVYSALRTSYNGDLVVNIVGNIKLQENQWSYTIIDNGIGQEQLQDSQLFFIGGTPFIAKTLTEKDGTAFYGNIKTKNVELPEELKEAIKESRIITPNENGNSEMLTFTAKKILSNSPSTFDSNYNYKLQTSEETRKYKTFKWNEIYRFGIQFQTELGQWTNVCWIGDAYQNIAPSYNSEEFIVADARYRMPNDVHNLAQKYGYVNYRILYADPEYSNGRMIKAQGILCPSMFNLGQRIQNAPFTIPSWVMRPRKGKLAYHHFEPLFSAEVEGGEIPSYTPKDTRFIEDASTEVYTTPFKESKEVTNSYIVTYFVVGENNKMYVRSVLVNSSHLSNNFYDEDGNEPTDYEVLCDYCVAYGGTSHNHYMDAFKAKNGVHTFGVGCDGPYGMAEDNAQLPSIYATYIDTNNISYNYVNSGNKIELKSLESVCNNHKLTLGKITSSDFKDFALLEPGNTNILQLFIRDTYGKDYVQAGLNVDVNPPDVDISLLNTIATYGIKDNIEYVVQNGDNNRDNHLKRYHDLQVLPLWTNYTPNTIIEGNYEKKTHHKFSSADVKLYNANQQGTIDYSEENSIKKYEDKIFSSTKSHYISHGWGTNTGTALNVGVSDDMYVKLITFPEIFRPHCLVNWFGSDNKGAYRGIQGNWGLRCSGYITIQQVTLSDDSSLAGRQLNNEYYIDESYLTFNSPEIENISASDNLKLRIVGVASINKDIPNIDITVNSFGNVESGSIVYSTFKNINTKGFNSPYNYFPYFDYKLVDNELIPQSTYYKSYLFAANNYIGIESADVSNDEYNILNNNNLPGTLLKQQQYNLHFSNSTNYFTPLQMGQFPLTVTYEGDESKFINDNVGNNSNLYYSRYENLIVSEDDTSHLYSSNNGESIVNVLSRGTTKIEFETTPHILINLQDEIKTKRYILPHFYDSDDWYSKASDSKLVVWDNKVFSNNNESENSEIAYEINMKESVRGEWKQSNAAFLNVLDGNNITLRWNIGYDKINTSDVENKLLLLHINLYSEYKDNSTVEGVIDFTNTFYKQVEKLPNYETIYDVNSYKDNSHRAASLLINMLLADNKQYIHNISSTIEEVGEGIYRYKDFKYPLYVALIPYISISYNDSETGLSSIGAYTTGLIKILSATMTDKGCYDFEYEKETDVILFKHPNLNTLCYINITDTASFKNINFGTVNDSDYLNDIILIPDLPIQYISKRIENENEPKNQYVFIGELYSDLSKEYLYGGTDDTALRNLTWLPASKVTHLGSSVTTMEGDTYYQRWDCLKTYPISEESKNQIVDITSFMVESHINLDERTDGNRNTLNLMSRPSNFNLFNTVYNQPNNIFSYTTDWNSNLSSEDNPNLVAWSMTKNKLGDVDSWTNVNLSSSTTVKYPVTKLLNYNNNVLAITEHSLEQVNFNHKQLVNTSDNTFIELQNSSKVDGTTTVRGTYGSYNMSTLITDTGLYFIEDNEKSIIKVTLEGAFTKLGGTDFTDWIKNNIIQGTYVNNNKKPFRLEYDPIHKDIYIINKDYQVIYNEKLEMFTSFITYSGEYWLYTFNGKLYAIRSDVNTSSYEMFGDRTYNNDFTGDNMTYSIWYRINPNAYTDKVFTNGIMIADCGVSGTNTPLPNNSKTMIYPFDTIRVWNEYQDTDIVPFDNVIDRPSSLKSKFRKWKFFIPRDVKSKWQRDRIRNPWIHLKLEGTSTDKIEVHNFLIQYME